MEPILQIKDLQVRFDTEHGVVQALDGVSLSVRKGEILGVVGESGSGKSVTALSVLRLIRKASGRISGGEVTFMGQDILSLSEKQMRKEIRGNRISMIFQDPMTFLNPVLTIGFQISEVFKIHFGLRGKEARERSIEVMRLLGIPSAEHRIHAYPHQFSGGMRQRIMIAAALVCEPDLLIADEPTTALDVTIQAQILKLLGDLRAKYQTAIILITHDLGVVAELADRVAVMYAGQVVESGLVGDIYNDAKHPYTRGLLRCFPNLDSQKTWEPIPGQVPDMVDIPNGCRYHPRCPEAMPMCAVQRPSETSFGDDHCTRCHLYAGGGRSGGDVGRQGGEA